MMSLFITITFTRTQLSNATQTQKHIITTMIIIIIIIIMIIIKIIIIMMTHRSGFPKG